MTQYFIKESDSLAKTTNDTATIQHAHKQPFCRIFIIRSIIRVLSYLLLTDQIILTTKETFYGITLVPKKPPLYVFEDK